MFAAPPSIDTEIYARLPDELRIPDTPTAWSDARGGPPLHSFLEGPSFDRDGNLYCVDVCHGRFFKISSLPRQSMESSCMPAWISPDGRCIHTGEKAEAIDVSTVKGIRCDDA